MQSSISVSSWKKKPAASAIYSKFTSKFLLPKKDWSLFEATNRGNSGIELRNRTMNVTLKGLTRKYKHDPLQDTRNVSKENTKLHPPDGFKIRVPFLNSKRVPKIVLYSWKQWSAWLKTQGCNYGNLWEPTRSRRKKKQKNTSCLNIFVRKLKKTSIKNKICSNFQSDNIILFVGLIMQLRTF